MVQSNILVQSKMGLHARPASEFTKLASGFECDVYVEKEDRKVNAKSILGVLSLGVMKDSSINIITNGNNEKEALSELLKFISGLEKN